MLFISIARAADSVLTYTLVSPFPGGKDTVQTLSDYAQYFFPFILSFAALAALVMFVIGGVQYMFSGASPEMAKGARERIGNAIWGLGIAVFAVIILGTINPKLVNLQLDLKHVGQCIGKECKFIFKDSGLPPLPPPDLSDQQKECFGDGECSTKICNFRNDSSPFKQCLVNNLLIGVACGDDRQCLSGLCTTSSPSSKGRFCQSNGTKGPRESCVLSEECQAGLACRHPDVPGCGPNSFDIPGIDLWDCSLKCYQK